MVHPPSFLPSAVYVHFIEILTPKEVERWATRNWSRSHRTVPAPIPGTCEPRLEAHFSVRSLTHNAIWWHRPMGKVEPSIHPPTNTTRKPSEGKVREFPSYGWLFPEDRHKHFLLLVAHKAPILSVYGTRFLRRWWWWWRRHSPLEQTDIGVSGGKKMFHYRRSGWSWT